MPLVSLANISFSKLRIDAPASKRKPAASTGHFGERSDSAQMAVKLIALSRVLLTKDAAVLSTVAASAHGAELLRMLMAATLRLAVLATGGSDLAASTSTILNLGNIATLFNVTGSTIARQSSFEALFGLPDKISWNDARAVYAALLDALAHARAMPAGAAVEQRLLMSNATDTDASATAVIDSFVAAVEERASHRLRTAPRPGVTSFSSSSFTSTTAVPTPPLLPAPSSPAAAALFDVPPLTLPPPAAFRIEPTTSVAANLMRLVEGQLPHSSPDDRPTIAAALDEGMSLLMPTATAARRQELLASNVLAALTHPGMAWLWASTIDATSSEVSGVTAMAISIVNSCSATAASLFAEAELQAALGF